MSDPHPLKHNLVVTLTVLSALMIGLTLVCLVAAVYNIYAYLYKQRIKRCLIVSFYFMLVVMLLAALV